MWKTIEYSTTYWQEVYDIKKLVSKKEFLNGQEVHIWQAPLEFNSSFYEKLSKDERKKANTFKFPRDQHRYITSHAILRIILSAYVGCHYTKINFKNTKYGKPFLLKNPVHFNMTHSADIVCYIMSVNNEVGIDIEYVQSDFNWFDIANKYFTSQELSHLMSLSRQSQDHEFFALFTQKEALLKAIGTGLVGLEEIKGTKVTSILNEYSLIPFNCGVNYPGTLAIKSQNSTTRFFRY